MPGATITCAFTNTKIVPPQPPVPDTGDQSPVPPVRPPDAGIGLPATGGGAWRGLTASGLLLLTLGFVLMVGGRRKPRMI